MISQFKFSFVLMLAFQIIQIAGVAQVERDSTDKKEVPNGTDGLTLTKERPDSTTKRLPPNEFKGQFSSFRIGLGYIADASTYVKDDVFNEQMERAQLKVDPIVQTRDFRILGSGVLTTKRDISWKFAYMYDGDQKVWMMRETGITLGLPEIKSTLFVGRTKEGFSMVKVMNGHSPWGYERQMAIDAIPILADGVKLMGFAPKTRIFWNLGYFNDFISEGQGFSTFEWQAVARVGFLPILEAQKGKALHIAINLRYAKPLNGRMTMKSRPESNNTPALINTGAFDVNNSQHGGVEIYYSAGRVTMGTEPVFHHYSGPDGNDHSFYGGNVMFVYSLTGGKRSYKPNAGIFGFIPVRKSVFGGGTGEIEAAVFVSTLNLNDGNIKGGQMYRITPMINWYLAQYMRMEFIYGYGILDRYDMKGTIQFFETRIQFTIM